VVSQFRIDAVDQNANHARSQGLDGIDSNRLDFDFTRFQGHALCAGKSELTIIKSESEFNSSKLVTEPKKHSASSLEQSNQLDSQR